MAILLKESRNYSGKCIVSIDTMAHDIDYEIKTFFSWLSVPYYRSK